MLAENVLLDGKTVLVTGAAGFIGSNLAKRLLQGRLNIRVVGVDNMNDYYDVRLKEERLKELSDYPSFVFIKGDISDKAAVDRIFGEYKPQVVVNLAAQAGVRYSISHPDAYIYSNIIGFYNILEACRHSYDNGQPGVEHLVYASSSSVYGSNRKVPYSTEDKVDNPVSLYAATKKGNEAYFGFTDKLVKGETIKIFNYGNCKRDFTYIDDIVEGIIRVMRHAPERLNGEDGQPVPPYKVYNIGNNHPENLLDFVTILQEELVRAGVLPEDYDFEAHKELVPMQPGDVPVTFADTTPLEMDFGFKPSTTLRHGLEKFAVWYKKYHECEG